MDVQTMHLTPSCFALKFTRPLDPATATHAESYAFNRYYSEYHQTYGSPKMDQAAVAVTAAPRGLERNFPPMLCDFH